MKLVPTLKTLIATTIILSIISAIVSSYLTDDMTGQSITMLSKQGEISAAILGGIIALAGLIASIGIFRLKRWAPPVYAICFLISILSTLIINPNLVSAFDQFSNQFLTVLNTAILAIIYLSPLREYFVKKTISAEQAKEIALA